MVRFAVPFFFGLLIPTATIAAPLPGFRKSAWFDEQVREEWVAEGVRAVVIAPVSFDSKQPTRLVIYATPNGNSSGCNRRGRCQKRSQGRALIGRKCGELGQERSQVRGRCWSGSRFRGGGFVGG